MDDVGIVWPTTRQQNNERQENAAEAGSHQLVDQ